MEASKISGRRLPTARPAVNDRPAWLASRLKPAGVAKPAASAQPPSGDFPNKQAGRLRQDVKACPRAICFAHSPHSRRRGLALMAFLAAGLLSTACWAQGVAPTAADQIVKQVRLDQRLNAQVPMDLQFHDEDGNAVPLRRFFHGKPVLINLIQYRCTMLCSQEMNVLSESLRELKFNVGEQFELITVSIDAREGPQLAREFKAGYLRLYGRPGAEQGWHFLTGDEATIHRLADTIGYHFAYDARTDQFAHPDGVIVLTPAGRVARYFVQLRYPARDLRLAMVEASQGRIGTPMDLFALLCYHYNPATGKYGLAVMKLMRLTAAATVLLLATGVLLMNRRGRQGQKRVGSG
jgi:protein SCO1/2